MSTNFTLNTRLFFATYIRKYKIINHAKIKMFKGSYNISGQTLREFTTVQKVKNK